MGERKEKELAEAGLDKALRSIVKEECTGAYLNDGIAEEVVSQIAEHIRNVLRTFEVARQYANRGLGRSYSLEVRVDASGVHESRLEHGEAGMGPLPPHIIGIFAFLSALAGAAARYFGGIFKKRSLIALGRRNYRLINSRAASARIIRASVQYSQESGWRWARASGVLALDITRSANQHIVIVGSSGYGKSTMLEAITEGVCNMGVPIVMFDAHGEHRSMIAALGGRTYDS
jgi:ABC-type glutathione transport system ATPase component